MINKPTIDELELKAENKYELCCAISRRAKTLNEMQARDELSTEVKTISLASEELAEGKTEIE